MKETTGEAGRLMGLVRTRPSREILSGDSADVYFARAATILEREGLDPLVTMEVFARQDAILCGIDEAKNLLGHVLADADLAETKIEALDDGDAIAPKEVVLRIRARYRQVGLYETAILGMLAQSTGWATAARECVEVGGARCRSSRSAPATSTPTSPTSSTTRRSSAAASARRRRPGRGWPACRRPGRCPTRSS